ncbi:MAG: hypothetical protein E6K70_11580 [Planctomycetota bacterium]|nr:MAG: hypothetical protein E6K70_11580 [Planctomycetota bacterium]
MLSPGIARAAPGSLAVGPVACHDATLPEKSIKSSSCRRLRTRGDGEPLAGPGWVTDRGSGHDNGSHGRAGGRVPSLAGGVGSAGLSPRFERAVILSPGPALQVPLGDVEIGSQKSEVRGQKSEINDGALTSDLRPLNSGRTLADAEREHIVNVVRETGCVLGGPKGAAARLGMKRSTLRWKMKRLGISRPI